MRFKEDQQSQNNKDERAEHAWQTAMMFLYSFNSKPRQGIRWSSTPEDKECMCQGTSHWGKTPPACSAFTRIAMGMLSVPNVELQCISNDLLSFDSSHNSQHASVQAWRRPFFNPKANTVVSSQTATSLQTKQDKTMSSRETCMLDLPWGSVHQLYGLTLVLGDKSKRGGLSGTP